MVSRVTVLAEGYVREDKEVLFASSTIVLIEDNGIKVLVDPGASKDILIDALQREALQPEDIDIIFLTHYHPDHMLNLKLFSKKRICDGTTIFLDDKEEAYEEHIPGTMIQVVKTPGHAVEHCSLIVKTGSGNVCISGDVFWWAEDEEQKLDKDSLIFHEDRFAADFEKLKESRKNLLDSSDFIIPGHGRTFKTSDVLKESTLTPSEFKVKRTENPMGQE